MYVKEAPGLLIDGDAFDHHEIARFGVGGEICSRITVKRHGGEIDARVRGRKRGIAFVLNWSGGQCRQGCLRSGVRQLTKNGEILHVEAARIVNEIKVEFVGAAVVVRA